MNAFLAPSSSSKGSHMEDLGIAEMVLFLCLIEVFALQVELVKQKPTVELMAKGTNKEHHCS